MPERVVLGLPPRLEPGEVWYGSVYPVSSQGLTLPAQHFVADAWPEPPPPPQPKRRCHKKRRR